MGKINWGRVLAGGLLAGLVWNILGFGAWALFLRKPWAAALEAIGRPLVETSGTNIFYVAYSFVLGIVAVWLYAAIRPRFGGSPKTAALAGFAFWLVGGLLPSLDWGVTLRLPAQLLGTSSVFGLVIVVVSVVVGAWQYKE